MALPQETIEAIRLRADVLQVIGGVVSLKKKGQRYVGLCPFHHEKTPSFSVTPERGLYYCFGCHAGGDVFSFVMRHDGLDFNAAARKLADMCGVKTEDESPAVRERRRQKAELAKANAYAQAFFEHALWREEGKAARAYIDARGIPESQARQFRLGFGGKTGALLTYLEAKKVPPKLAVQAGFVNQEADRGLFDERLVFPILTHHDRIVGFGGRRLAGESGPKYINTRESALFRKRHLLYGWLVAEESIRRDRRVTLVEGYMDVLACHRAGVTTAVAALGTAFGEEHARTCARLAQEALLLFDGDVAGIRASREATVQIARAVLKALVAPLAPGDDPDSLLRREGEGALAAHIKEAQSAIEHFIAATVRPQMSIEDRSRAAEELAPLILALGSGLERDLYTARLAEAVGVNVEGMKLHLAAAQKKGAKKKPRREASSTPAVRAPARPTPFEVKILREVMLYPQITKRLAELTPFASDPMRLLCDEVAHSKEPLARVLERHLGKKIAQDLMAVEPPSFANEEDATKQADRTWHDARQRLELAQIEAAHEQVLEELRAAEADDADPIQTADLMRRSQELVRRKRELRRPPST